MDKQDQVFIFKVSLQKKIYRTMELKGASSLHQFAETITRAFDFQFDHPFGFYNNIKSMYDSTEAYTCFCDTGHAIQPNEKSVKNTNICMVFEPSKKMLFHFDYGEDWEFLVECLGVVEPEIGKTYPKITKKIGKAPEQYPDPEPEYEDEDDDDE